MQGVAEFHKVSFNQFLQDIKKTGFFDDETPDEIVKLVYESIVLPRRGTSGSAGYDFYLPIPFSMYSDSVITVPTGVKVDIEPGWFLELVPRSSLGFKHGMRLMNSVAIIDSDYSHADNEGHIMVRFTCDRNMCLQQGERFVQGILLQHGIAKNDEVINAERTGGVGSTGKK